MFTQCGPSGCPSKWRSGHSSGPACDPALAVELGCDDGYAADSIVLGAVGVAASGAVGMGEPWAVREKVIRKDDSELSKLYTALDQELVRSTKEHLIVPSKRQKVVRSSQEEVRALWRDFLGTDDELLSSFIDYTPASDASRSAVCFKVELPKKPGNFGFAVHATEDYPSILFVDEIVQSGPLDICNQRARSEKRCCVQPLAVVLAVNSVSGDGNAMKRELQLSMFGSTADVNNRDSAAAAMTMILVNAPSVELALGVKAYLRSGIRISTMFWESAETWEEPGCEDKEAASMEFTASGGIGSSQSSQSSPTNLASLLGQARPAIRNPYVMPSSPAQQCGQEVIMLCGNNRKGVSIATPV